MPVINNIDKYYRQEYFGFVLSDDHGIFNVRFDEIKDETEFMFIKRRKDLQDWTNISMRAEKEGISIVWEGNPFEFKGPFK